MAGPGRQFGSQFLPRNGQEVIVAFIDGNPERPIIIGRVYNASSATTNLPFPAKATAKKMLQKMSDLKRHRHQPAAAQRYQDAQHAAAGHRASGSTCSASTTPGGSEQFLIRSQGRLDVTALGTKYETLGGSYNLAVGGIDNKREVAGGNYVSKVYCDYTLHVGDPSGPYNGGNRYERVEKNYELNVKQDTAVSLEGDLAAEVGGVASAQRRKHRLARRHRRSPLRSAEATSCSPRPGVYASGPQSSRTSPAAARITASMVIADGPRREPGERRSRHHVTDRGRNLPRKRTVPSPGGPGCRHASPMATCMSDPAGHIEVHVSLRPLRGLRRRRPRPHRGDAGRGSVARRMRRRSNVPSASCAPTRRPPCRTALSSR